MKITLEQVDEVINRTSVSYAYAKEALEVSQGDVLDAIIFIEKNKKEESKSKKVEDKKESAESVEELKAWFKNIIDKGNVARIKILKEESIIADVPVNAGIAAGVIAVLLPHILALVVIAAVVTKITIEITMTDGSVEVVNKYVYKAVNEAKAKTSNITEKMKNKVTEMNINEISDIFKNKSSNINKENKENEEEITTFRYTVNFDKEEK